MNNRVVKDEMSAIYCNGMQVKRVHNLKYLGITFDGIAVLPSAHTDHVIQQAQKGLSSIKAVARWDMQQQILAQLMQTLVLAAVNYRPGLLTLSTTQT